jgi:hypothetical protein
MWTPYASRLPDDVLDRLLKAAAGAVDHVWRSQVERRCRRLRFESCQLGGDRIESPTPSL